MTKSQPTVHFLICYDYDTQAVHLDEFLDMNLATKAYADLERHHARETERFEIVLVGADSIETVMKTHGHYFAGDTNPTMFSEFVSEPAEA